MYSEVCVYLHVADSSLLEGAVLQVVGADVTIFTPMTRKHAADTGGTPKGDGQRQRDVKTWRLVYTGQTKML